MDDNEDILVELEEEEDLQLEEGKGEDTVSASEEDDDEQGSSEDKDKGKAKSRDRGAERRIAQLTAERRSAEERAAAAEARLRDAEAERERITGEASYYLDRATTSEEEALTSAIEGARARLKQAHEDGDAEGVADATVAITKLDASMRDVKRNKDAKARYLADQEKRKTQAPQQQQTQQNGVQNYRQVEPSEKALTWKESNKEWFGRDEVMTNVAFQLHHTMVNNEGYDPESDDYYEDLDARLREYFPPKRFGNGVGKTAKGGQAEQLVAGAARAPARGKSKSVKLTSSERQIARDLGLTDKQYAIQKMKMQQRGQEA